MHPNCRSKTRGYLGKEGEKLLQRRARNPFTGETEIIPNMSYKQWAKRYNDNTLKVNENGVWSFNSLRDKGIKDNFNNAHKFIDLDNKENKAIYQNIDKLKTKVLKVGKTGACYDKVTNTVYLPDKVTARNSGTTIHEMGHAIDFVIGKKLGTGQLSLSGNLTKLIDDYYANNKGNMPTELDNYLNNILGRVSKKIGMTNSLLVKQARQELAKTNYRYDAPNRLTDIYSALSKGKINSQIETFGSHGLDYWRNLGMRETELFAQFTYLKMTNSKKELKVLEQNVPDIYNELNLLYNKASKEIRRL